MSQWLSLLVAIALVLCVAHASDSSNGASQKGSESNKVEAKPDNSTWNWKSRLTKPSRPIQNRDDRHIGEEERAERARGIFRMGGYGNMPYEDEPAAPNSDASERKRKAEGEGNGLVAKKHEFGSSPANQ